MKTFKEFYKESTALDRRIKKHEDTVKNNPNLMKKIKSVEAMGEINRRLGISSLNVSGK